MHGSNDEIVYIKKEKELYYQKLLQEYQVIFASKFAISIALTGIILTVFQLMKQITLEIIVTSVLIGVGSYCFFGHKQKKIEEDLGLHQNIIAMITTGINNERIEKAEKLKK